MKQFIDKLIGRLEEEHEICINQYGVVGGNPYAFEVMQCIEIINEVAEEYNNGWIPCEVRLPGYYDNVLVCTKDGGRTIAHLTHSPIEWKDIHNYKIENIIAWQSLPAPYKKGE